jgi:Ca2+-binding EF-hand superfamily protein
VHVINVSDPLRPEPRAFVATLDPQALELSGDVLYVADGEGGVALLDLAKPEAPVLLARFPTVDAQALDVEWPWMVVADGAGGLVVADVTVPIAPQFLSALDLGASAQQPSQAVAVRTLFQYSRPCVQDGAPAETRTTARNLCAALDRKLGLFLIDLSEPSQPRVLFPVREAGVRSERLPDTDYRDLVLLSQIDPAEPQGGESTAERDYAYVLFERGSEEARRSTLRAIDVSDPARTRWFGRDRDPIPMGERSTRLVAGDYYNPPFRRRLLFSCSDAGLTVSDFSTTREPVALGTLPGLRDTFAMAIEEFPLDRMIDEQGKPLKDVSHEGSRWLRRSELERILSVDAAALGLERPDEPWSEPPAWAARLELARADVDRSGRLEGVELDGGSRAYDADGDGRVSLRELARLAPLSRASRRAEPALGAGASGRTGPDGDLARLLDGTSPLEFDGNRDGRLDRSEAERAFFAALDLDHDGQLTRDELARYPGLHASLWSGDAAAQAAFRASDRNGDGWLTPREFRLADAEWSALDADRDGKLRLKTSDLPGQRERGFQVQGSEWPARRSYLVPVPPNATPERLLERFDRDKNGALSRSELAARKDLFALADSDGSSIVTRAELADLLGIVATQGVEACPDDFLSRWDLDASGRIEPGELSDVALLRLERSLRAD